MINDAFWIFLFCLPHWVHNSRSSTTSTGKWGHGLITGSSTLIPELGHMTYPWCICPHSRRWEIGCTFILRKLLVCLWIYCWICCHNICRSVHVCACACACVGLHPMRQRNKMRHSRKRGRGGRKKLGVVMVACLYLIRKGRQEWNNSPWVWAQSCLLTTSKLECISERERNLLCMHRTWVSEWVSQGRNPKSVADGTDGCQATSSISSPLRIKYTRLVWREWRVTGSKWHFYISWCPNLRWCIAILLHPLQEQHD